MAEQEAERRTDYEAELRLYHALWALLFSALLWVFQSQRNWKVTLIGLPTALLLAYGLLTPLVLFVVEGLVGQ